MAELNYSLDKNVAPLITVSSRQLHTRAAFSDCRLGMTAQLMAQRHGRCRGTEMTI